ncbi:MAG: TusE/DsrC/DsvC family sulfur relay protein [Alphaproteobacteria bacterium]|nr:TusE/DsrC/DsvC family sulfur relay protein [Alphaproteobacteria bacterium]
MQIQTDAEGYLVEPEDWNEDVAKELARRENIELTDEHWEAMNYMRSYLQQHKVAPDVRHVMKHLSQALGSGRNRVFELFPYGYVQQACKVAGMRRPRAWSTG